MKGLLSLLLSSLWTSCLHAQLSPEWTQFQDFMLRYNKPYSNDSPVFQARFLAFKESLQRHQWLNSYETQSGGSAVYGVNKFSDLTPLEFKEMYLSGLRSSGSRHSRSTAQRMLPTPPKKFDWREKKHVIGRVWNQGQCGSCWAFATVETIGSKYSMQAGHLVELSAQQLISCDTGPELQGCAGGALLLAFSSVRDKNITIVKASTYPFKSGDGKSHTCNTNLPNVGVRVLNFTYLQRPTDKYNETEMLAWLVNYSPLTVSVNARSWQDYEGGIIQHHCDGYPPDVVDHAVQVVGYDLTGPVPFWIVRNTWGTDWGEDGYVKLKFNHNMCGMTDEVAFVEKVIGVGM